MNYLKSIMLVLSILTVNMIGKADDTRQTSNVPFQVSVPTQKISDQEAFLELQIKDSQPSSGVCRYYVTKLLMVKSLRTLIVEIQKDPCLNEAWGFSQGVVYLDMPKSFVNSNLQTCLIVNNSIIGEISYSQALKNFKVDETGNCLIH